MITSHLLSFHLGSAKNLASTPVQLQMMFFSSAVLEKQVVWSSRMVGILDQIGILDCAGIGWLLIDQAILNPTSLYPKSIWLNKCCFPQLHWNAGLQWYKLVVSWPADNPRQLVEARGAEKNSHKQWCNRLCSCLPHLIKSFHCPFPLLASTLLYKCVSV